MARFGRLPVTLPEGIKAEIKDGSVIVSGSKGSVTRSFPKGVSVKQEGNDLVIGAKGEEKYAGAIKGTMRAHLLNMIKGVTEGWKKDLEIVGTGFRAEVRGSDLVLTVGYSHTVTIKAPEGVKFSVTKNVITVEGVDRDAVGQTSANIRAVRPPDAYQGKGIRYSDEIVKKKPGKQAAKTAGA
jgi:large subunit ribosomal protein L6